MGGIEKKIKKLSYDRKAVRERQHFFGSTKV